MRRRSPLLPLFLVTTGTVTAWTFAARAGELRYDAPAGCPARDAVVERAATRAPTARDATMSVSGSAGHFAGDLSIGVGGEDAVERHVEGRTCEAVVDALVLVLALDRTAPEPTAPAGVATTAETPAVASGPTASAAAERAPVAAHDGQRSPIEVGIGLGFEHRALGYTTVMGGVVAGELAAPALFGWTRYRPSARVGAAHLFRPDGDGGYFRSTTFTGAAVHLCPVGLAAIASEHVDLTFSACGVLNAGSAGAKETVAWFDGGALVRAAAQVGRKDRPRFFFELSGGMLKRLGQAAPFPVGASTPVTTADAAGSGFDSGAMTYVLEPSTMFTIALGAGVVFP